jgi:hypothetical protein
MILPKPPAVDPGEEFMGRALWKAIQVRLRLASFCDAGGDGRMAREHFLRAVDLMQVGPKVREGPPT